MINRIKRVALAACVILTGLVPATLTTLAAPPAPAMALCIPQSHTGHNSGGETVTLTTGCAGESWRADVRSHLHRSVSAWRLARKGSQLSALVSGACGGGIDVERTGSTGGGTFHRTWGVC